MFSVSCLFGNGIFPQGTTLHACGILSEQFKQMLFAFRGMIHLWGARSCAVQPQLRVGAPILQPASISRCTFEKSGKTFSVTSLFSFLPCLSSLSRFGQGWGSGLWGFSGRDLHRTTPFVLPVGFVLPVTAA